MMPQFANAYLMHFSILQLFQELLDAVLTVTRLWQRGDCAEIALNDDLDDAVIRFTACLEIMHHQTGTSITFPKAHDMWHIVRDVKLYGASENYDLGKPYLLCFVDIYILYIQDDVHNYLLLYL